MKEEYVTYEQAVKLKELGFDLEVNHYYDDEKDLVESLADYNNEDSYHSSETAYDDFNHGYCDEVFCSAPTLSQAQAWLRDKGIHIALNPYSISPDRYDGDNYFWSFELYQVPTGGWLKVNGGGFDTYELALSAGIDKALELLTDNPK